MVRLADKQYHTILDSRTFYCDKTVKNSRWWKILYPSVLQDWDGSQKHRTEFITYSITSFKLQTLIYFQWIKSSLVVIFQMMKMQIYVKSGLRWFLCRISLKYLEFDVFNFLNFSIRINDLANFWNTFSHQVFYV